MKESTDAKTEKINMLTTKPTEEYKGSPAMNYARDCPLTN